MLKSTLVMTTAAAIAVAGFSLQPAAAASHARGIAKQQGQDLSAVRKRGHRYGPARGFPLAAFGAVAGTIAGIAAAERRRDYYEHPYGYYAPGYLYEAPVAAPYAYGPPAYQYRGYGYQGGFHGYHGGYHGGGPTPQTESIMNPSPGY